MKTSAPAWLAGADKAFWYETHHGDAYPPYPPIVWEWRYYGTIIDGEGGPWIEYEEEMGSRFHSIDQSVGQLAVIIDTCHSGALSDEFSGFSNTYALMTCRYAEMTYEASPLVDTMIGSFYIQGRGHSKGGIYAKLPGLFDGMCFETAVDFNEDPYYYYTRDHYLSTCHYVYKDMHYGGTWL